VTLIILRQFVETDLSDSSLQVILDAANEDVTLAIGSDTSQIETFKGDGRVVYWIQRPVASFTSIITTDSGGTATTLVKPLGLYTADPTDDYLMDGNAQAITRLSTGTNGKGGWTDTTVFTYVPADLNKRNRSIVQLVELDLAFRPGARSENVGEMSRSMQDYDAERARIINAARARAFA
jgi:hypothetical protein